MTTFGKPVEITNDKGTTYRLAFEEFCRANKISHQISAAYMPAPNGRAEVALQILKYDQT